MFQSADSAPSSTVLGAPVIGAIVHQSSPLSPTNWHKISPIRSSSHKERTITAVSIGFHSPFFWTLLSLNSCSSSLWVDLICSELMHGDIRLVLTHSLTFWQIFLFTFLCKITIEGPRCYACYFLPEGSATLYILYRNYQHWSRC